MTPSHTPAALDCRAPVVCSAGELRRMMRASQGDAVQRERLRLDRILGRDSARALVEVQAGTTWQALGAFLAETAPTLGRCAAHGILPGSVGEALAVNAPAPDGQPLVALVEAVTLITPDGELQRASRLRNAELFALAVGGQDLFGLTYSVTLRVDALAQAAQHPQTRAPRVLHTGTEGAGPVATLLVPPEKLDVFLETARALCDEWRAPIARIEVLRTRAEHETMLRWAKRDYATVALELALPIPLGACVRGVQIWRALIDCAIGVGGSFPIASTRAATRAQLEICYPELRAVLAEKARRDPSDRMGNAWVRHHRRVLDAATLSVRWNPAQAASA